MDINLPRWLYFSVNCVFCILLLVDEMGEYFGKKEVMPTFKKKERKSFLSLQIEQFASVPHNPFMEYAKFDGKVCDHLFSLHMRNVLLWYSIYCFDKKNVNDALYLTSTV